MSCHYSRATWKQTQFSLISFDLHRTNRLCFGFIVLAAHGSNRNEVLDLVNRSKQVSLIDDVVLITNRYIALSCCKRKRLI